MISAKWVPGCPPAFCYCYFIIDFCCFTELTLCNESCTFSQVVCVRTLRRRHLELCLDTHFLLIVCLRANQTRVSISLSSLQGTEIILLKCKFCKIHKKVAPFLKVSVKISFSCILYILLCFFEIFRHSLFVPTDVTSL